MRTIIAAAVLAAGAGTGVSAAVYEVDFTAEVTSADEFFAFSAGDVTTNSFTFGEDGGNPYVTYECSIFGYTCNPGVTAQAGFGDDGSLISFGAAIKTIMGGPGFDANLSSGTGQLRDEGPFLLTQALNFEITDSTVTVSDPDIAPVPLPASAPLLALGVGGLAWMRRRSA